MEAGFEHLRGLTELRRVVLVNNKYLSDDSISFLVAYTKAANIHKVARNFCQRNTILACSW